MPRVTNSRDIIEGVLRISLRKGEIAAHAVSAASRSLGSR